MKNELIAVENINVAAVFDGSGMDDLLVKIKDEALSVVPDVTTNKGRKEVASMAAKVAKSKTYLDGLGKDLVSDWKTKAKAVDNERKKMRDSLDSLKVEIRQPLTDWEESEKNKAADIHNKILAIAENGEVTNWIDLDIENLEGRLKYVELVAIDDSFGDRVNDAAKEKDRSITNIKEAITKRLQYDAEQVELENMRIAAAEREEEERKEKLRKEGEERARNEAQAAAEAKELQAKLEANAEKERLRVESERVEREKQDAINAKEAAEKRAKEAEDHAAQQAEQAAQDERDRIENERIAEELAAKKREEDTKHRAKINNAAAKAMNDSLMAYDTGERALTLKQAKLVVTAIAKGQIPHVSISY